MVCLKPTKVSLEHKLHRAGHWGLTCSSRQPWPWHSPRPCTALTCTVLTCTGHCKWRTLQRQLLGYTIWFIPLTALYLSAFVTQKKVVCSSYSALQWLYISIVLYQSLVHCCSFECFVSGRSELSVTVLMESLRSTPDQRQWWWWWWCW